ncbi:uncharacterized protein [Labrus bergylta]|uniref:uncharacterized protein isoform X4 n=1 Tax=Labrus bergylta TaxID=56723 RepID=UPI0033144B8A
MASAGFLLLTLAVLNSASSQTKYGVPTIQPQPQDIDLNTDGSLTCKSTGYPKGRLSWFDKDNKPWLDQPEVEVLKTENGLFILSSTLKIQRGSAFSQYTCKVFNARGDEEAEKSFTVQDKPPSARGLEQGAKDTKDSNRILATKIVAPVLVVGSLIVGLLLLLLYNRRSQRDHQVVIHMEEGDDQETEGDVQESLTTGETKTTLTDNH